MTVMVDVQYTQLPHVSQPAAGAAVGAGAEAEQEASLFVGSV